MSVFLQVDTWISLVALSLIEIIMGVDNLLLIAIVTHKLPKHQQKLARRVGLLLAMVMRLGLLAAVVWLASLTEELFTIGPEEISIRDLVLICGGIFLLIKSVHEILELKRNSHDTPKAKSMTFMMALVQIVLFDILFSLDSVITAVGIAQDYVVMACAIVIAVLVMLFASEPASRFIMANKRMQILALSILFLVGIHLVLSGLNLDISPVYIFIAMAFGLMVELVSRFVEKGKTIAQK